MTKSFPCTLLFLLCAYIGQGQILGAEISPGGENQDTVIFTASIYYECIDLPKINDTLLVQTVDPVLDTIAKIFAPRRTDVDTITYDCARCICNRDECGRPYIIKQTFYYEFSKGANGLFGRCRLRASFMPGKRVDSLSFIKTAQSTEIRVEAEINTCKNTGVSDYYFALPPEFHAIKDEYYISSPGLGLQMSNRSRYHLFTAELVNPIDDHRDTLRYETNYSAEDPLYYNGFPNTNNNFPRGFHLNDETGDLRFTPTKRGHSLIKTRYYVDGDSVGLGFAEREFALHVIAAKPESPPLLSGRDFSSFLNRDNYRLSLCANSGKSIGFKISDINSGSYLFPRVTIPAYLQPYLKYSYSNDTLIFTGDLDSFLTEGREHRVFVQIYDSSCAIGSSSSYTLRLSNSKTPKAIPRFDYLGKRRIQMETVPVDSFWALSYTWRMNGQSFNKKDTSLQLNVPGDYKYVHISYGEYGCNDTVRGTYTSPAFPYIKLKANTTIFCEGTELELEPDYLNTSETPAALWNGQINALIFKTTVTGDSLYTAQVTFSDSSVSIDTFVVEYLPAPPAAIVSKGQHCKGNKMLLKAVQDSSAKDSSDQTIWFFNDQLVGSNETVTIEGEGVLRLEVPYPNGCVAKTLQDIEYTKRSALFQKTYSTCANETLPIDLDNDPNAAYTWLIKDSVWLENSPNFVLERPVVNQPLIVKSTYDNDTISCVFEDTVSIEIKAHLTFSVLTDSFFCANDSFVYLLDSSFIQPNDGIWIDSNSRSPIYDTFFLDPSKGKQGQVLEKLYYQTEHPTTGCTYTRPVGLGIHNLPKPWVADSIKLCIGGPTILLNDGRYSNPTSGTWSGTGVIEIDSLQYFSPTLVGINSVNTIQYEIANEAGCVVKQPSIVTVNLKPDPVGLRRFAAAPGSIAFIDNRDDADSCIVDWWFWDFHDPFAPKCTTAVDDASFDGTKCRYSRREKPVHYYTVSGTYDVTLVVKNTQTNIQDQITKEDHVNLLGSGFEENWIGKMAIYPNPNDGGFTIASTEIVGASRYLIFNPLGKIVQEGNITSIEQKIDLRTSTSGMHWVAVYNHDGARIGFQSVLIKQQKIEQLWLLIVIMAQNEVFNSSTAPEPVGLYPHARRVGNLLFLSGIGPRSKGTKKIPGVALDENGNIVSYDIVEQTKSVFANVKAVLEASGSSWDQLVDVTVFLTNMKDDFKAYNQVWAEYFKEGAPCRTTVEILSLPTPIAIELKCVATVQKMSVAIDFGNSKIKIGLFSVDEVQPKQTWTADYQSASFSEILAELPDTEYCIYSQVRHDESLTSLIERRFSKAVPLHYQLNLPFAIDYGTPETLGNDRIASCAGAMELFADRPLLVIDAGTCITYDLISVDNRFMGGAISPGIEMKLKAMAHFTDKLPKATLSTEQEPLNIGKSTIECLLTGAVMGTIHEISGFVATFGKQQSLTTVLTGGDSQYLADNLENSTFAAPNLVLIGLNKIGKLNA